MARAGLRPLHWVGMMGAGEDLGRGWGLSWTWGPGQQGPTNCLGGVAPRDRGSSFLPQSVHSLVAPGLGGQELQEPGQLPLPPVAVRDPLSPVPSRCYHRDAPRLGHSSGWVRHTGNRTARCPPPPPPPPPPEAPGPSRCRSPAKNPLQSMCWQGTPEGVQTRLAWQPGSQPGPQADC